MSQITFKDYMSETSKLYEAMEETPKRTASYTMRKYCKIPVGECKDSKQYVSLKPKQKITVAWLYEDADNPTPISVNFQDVKDVDPESEHAAFWKGTKLLDWLIRNAAEE